MELLVALPRGIKRSQLQVSLRDAAANEDAWINAIETSGGAALVAERPQLLVRPLFFPTPLVDGILRGRVELHECSFQLVCRTSDSPSADIWDGLQVTLRKADSGTWGGAFISADALQTSHAAGDALAPIASEALTDAGALVQRMTTATADGVVLGAEAEPIAVDCVQAMASFSAADLLSAKALPQVSLAMRVHSEVWALQSAGCALLATLPPSTNRAICLELRDSGLLRVATTAAFNSRSDLRTRRHCAEALLGFARAAVANGAPSRGGCPIIAACTQRMLLDEGTRAVELLVRFVSTEPPPLREVACEALRVLAASGERCFVHALCREGALKTMFSQLFAQSPPAAPQPQMAWRCACFRPLLALALSSEVDVQRALLDGGLLLASLEMLSVDPPLTPMLSLRAIGVLSWGASTEGLRHASRAELRRLKAASRLISAVEAQTEGEAPEGEALREMEALRVAALRCLYEESTLYKETAAEVAAAQESAAAMAEQVETADSAKVAQELLEARFALEWLSKQEVGGSATGGNASHDASPVITNVSAAGGAAEQITDDPRVIEWHADAQSTAIVESAAAAALVWEQQQQQRAVAALVCGGGRAPLAVASMEMALEVLLRMARDCERRRRQLLDAGAGPVLLRALPTIGMRGGRQATLLCSALAQLSPACTMQEAMLESSQIRNLVDLFEEGALSLDSQSAASQRQVSLVLCNLALRSSATRDRLLSHGAEDALKASSDESRRVDALAAEELLEMLRTSAHHAKLQLEGCTRLSALLELARPFDETAVNSALATTTRGASAVAGSFPTRGVVSLLGSMLCRHEGCVPLQVGALRLLDRIITAYPLQVSLLPIEGSLFPLLHREIVEHETDRTGIVRGFRVRGEALEAACAALHALAQARVRVACVDQCDEQTCDEGRSPEEARTRTPVQEEAAALLRRVIALKAVGTESSTVAEGAVPPEATGSSSVHHHASCALTWLSLHSCSLLSTAATSTELAISLSCWDEAQLMGMLLRFDAHGAMLTLACIELAGRISAGRASTLHLLRLGVLRRLTQMLGSCVALGDTVTSAAMALLAALSESREGLEAIIADAEHVGAEQPGSKNSNGPGLLSSSPVGPLALSSLLSAVLTVLMNDRLPSAALRSGCELLARVLQKRVWLCREASTVDVETAREHQLALIVAVREPLLRLLESSAQLNDQPALSSDMELGNLSALADVLGAMRSLSRSPLAAAALLAALPHVLALTAAWPPAAGATIAADCCALIRLLIGSAALTPAGECTRVGDCRLENGDNDGEIELRTAQLASLSREEAAASLGAALHHLVHWLHDGCVFHIAEAASASESVEAAQFEPKSESQIEAEAALHLERAALLGTLLVAQTPARIGVACDAAVAPETSEPIISPAALGPLISLLKAHRSHFEVQCEGCRALASYLQHESASVASASVVVRTGGVKALLFAMRTHIKKEQLQEHAMLALRLLCVGATAQDSPGAAISAKATSSTSQMTVLSANGVAMLAAVLKRHDGSSSVQCNGCATLSALALGSQAGLEALAKASDGVEALVGSLRHCAQAPAPRDRTDAPSSVATLEMGKAALRALHSNMSTLEPSGELHRRIERANGSRFLT